MFRHTMATLMLEGGADIRYIQQMLGHADLSTHGDLHARGSIRKLQQIHTATHPGATLERKTSAATEEETGQDDEMPVHLNTEEAETALLHIRKAYIRRIKNS